VQTAAATKRKRPRHGAVDLDVRSIRAGLGLSPPGFAKAFGIPMATLRDWEQGRNVPAWLHGRCCS
jgi:DNA-binding transcriptional regulator YiaG